MPLLPAGVSDEKESWIVKLDMKGEKIRAVGLRMKGRHEAAPKEAAWPLSCVKQFWRSMPESAGADTYSGQECVSTEIS